MGPSIAKVYLRENEKTMQELAQEDEVILAGGTYSCLRKCHISTFGLNFPQCKVSSNTYTFILPDGHYDSRGKNSGKLLVLQINGNNHAAM